MFLKWLGFDPEKHSVRTEILAGLTTFLTMAYILAVNPNVFDVLGGEMSKANGAAFSSAVFFAIALLFAPLFLAIPSAATAPALIVVGMMMTPVVKINWKDPVEALPAFITMAVMPFCFSISDGILIGMISYVLLNAFCGKFKDITPTMWVLATLFVFRYIFI